MNLDYFKVVSALICALSLSIFHSRKQSAKGALRPPKTQKVQNESLQAVKPKACIKITQNILGTCDTLHAFFCDTFQRQIHLFYSRWPS